MGEKQRAPRANKINGLPQGWMGHEATWRHQTECRATSVTIGVTLSIILGIEPSGCPMRAPAQVILRSSGNFLPACALLG